MALSALKKKSVSAASVKQSPLKQSLFNKQYQALHSAATQRWQALSNRDRMALTILMLFLLLFVGGYGGYSVHMAAKQGEATYKEAVSEYFWLRSQAGNIDPKAGTSAPNQNNEATASSAITTVLTQAAINDANVVQAGDAVQFSFTNNSQATVGRVLANIQQQGWQFSRLSVQQDPVSKMLQVQGTVNK